MIVTEMLAKAREMGCSDVHLTVGLPPMGRLNGSLIPFEGIICENNAIKLVVDEILPARLIDKLKSDEDCDFSYLSPQGFRHRVNVYRQRGCYAVAIRLLNDSIPTLKQLALPEILGKLSLMPRGLVLVTGPTGSGKSTTLAAMIDHINNQRNSHVLIVEDPIEYVHEHKKCMINQREIGTDVESFSLALRSSLREDPDVILVGEMRDFETISAAITAAETGHLVMSTLHTTDAASTIDRIIDVFPPHQQQQIRAQLAGVLVGIISQQLVPRSGGKGRVAVLEILVATDAIANMIRDNKVHQIPNAIQTGRSVGMQSRDFELARLVREGVIEEHEALQRCSSPEDFKRFKSAPISF